MGFLLHAASPSHSVNVEITESWACRDTEMAYVTGTTNAGQQQHVCLRSALTLLFLPDKYWASSLTACRAVAAESLISLITSCGP